MEAKERKDARAKTRPRSPSAMWTRGGGKVRAKNLAISAESRERLALEALRSGATEGAIVDGLIDRHLRRYAIVDRGDRTAAAGDEPGLKVTPPHARDSAAA